jgi:hypothetical protein
MTIRELDEYKAAVSRALLSATVVPFVAVSPDGWQPKIAGCHPNVDRFVDENPGHTAVRGWVTLGTDGGTQILLTHHSVVRRSDGRLFDLTPLEDESIRPTMRFVPHVGSEDFFHLKNLFQPFLICDVGG